MESKRDYIDEKEAFDYMQRHNIEELPSFNHCISSNLSIKEQKATNVASYNIGVDSKGIYLSFNESYINN